MTTPAFTFDRVRAMDAAYTPERIFQGDVAATLLAAPPTQRYLTIRINAGHLDHLPAASRRTVASEYVARAITMVSIPAPGPLWRVTSRGELVFVLERCRPAHVRDEDCAMYLTADGSCSWCGAVHTHPCPACGGAGYHRAGCTSEW